MPANTAPHAVIVVDDFRPVRRNTLRGFATVTMPSGMIFLDVPVHLAENGNAWASPAARPVVRDGQVALDDRGKARWEPVVDFVDRDTRARWSELVIEAVRRTHPEAFT